MGQTMAQVNVSHLNKKGVNAKWDELEKTFPPDKYAGCLTECNHEMSEFLNAHNLLSLCVRAGLEALSCQPAPMPNGSTKLELTTSARMTQNEC